MELVIIARFHAREGQKVGRVRFARTGAGSAARAWGCFHNGIAFHARRAPQSSFLIGASRASGFLSGEWRATILPARSIRNFVKFHFMFAVPRKPRFARVRYRYSGCALGPFTSIFANMGNLTP